MPRGSLTARPVRFCPKSMPIILSIIGCKDNKNMSTTNKNTIRRRLIITAKSMMGITIFFLGAVAAYLLLAYTPLRTIIPGVPSEHARIQQIETAMRMDSLETCIRRWELYSENLRAVIAGGKPKSIESIMQQAGTLDVERDEATLMHADSTLRATIADQERFEISDRNKRNLQIEGMHFFEPVNGAVAVPFEIALHPYVDIVAAEGSIVSATLDGSVIYTGWNETYGWSIVLQHENNIVSIYRHNRNLLKKVADKVSAGSAIGMVGGSGKSEPSHLQFELWQNGTPVDPATFINF